MDINAILEEDDDLPDFEEMSPPPLAPPARAPAAPVAAAVSTSSAPTTSLNGGSSWKSPPPPHRAAEFGRRGGGALAKTDSHMRDSSARGDDDEEDGELPADEPKAPSRPAAHDGLRRDDLVGDRSDRISFPTSGEPRGAPPRSEPPPRGRIATSVGRDLDGGGGAGAWAKSAHGAKRGRNENAGGTVDGMDDGVGDVDVDMKDDMTYVPLEPKEVSLVEHICKKIAEPKKHLIRLLVKAFGATMAEGALKETMRIEKAGGDMFVPAPGKPAQRRSTGGVFLMVIKRRAPEKDVKRVMDESKEIDKKIKKLKQKENPHYHPQKLPRQ